MFLRLPTPYLFLSLYAFRYRCYFFFFFFFFNDTATTEIYTLPYTTLFRSLVPVSASLHSARVEVVDETGRVLPPRSEEHTSELQSRSDLVCRLLLEKKKKNTNLHPDPISGD